MGNRSGAYEELGKLNDAILEQVERYFPAMSEAERTKFWSNSQNFVLNYFGFHLKSTDQTWLTSMLETRWATKGILLQSAKKLKEGIMSSGDSTLINSYEEWMTARADLARYYSMPKRTVFSQGVKLDKLEERANELEKGPEPAPWVETFKQCWNEHSGCCKAVGSQGCIGRNHSNSEK